MKEGRQNEAIKEERKNTHKERKEDRNEWRRKEGWEHRKGAFGFDVSRVGLTCNISNIPGRKD
jgi:hypothetical protein